MTRDAIDREPLEEPLAEFERQIISAYLAGAGHDLQALLARDDDEAHKLLADASRYASERLTEVETRFHYIRHLHGEP
jgi:hypothetical protein